MMSDSGVRPTKKYKMKERKKHPYKNRGQTHNEEGTWALVDEEGNIVESFRTMGGATTMTVKYENKSGKKLFVKQIKPNKFKPYVTSKK